MFGNISKCSQTLLASMLHACVSAGTSDAPPRRVQQETDPSAHQPSRSVGQSGGRPIDRTAQTWLRSVPALSRIWNISWPHLVQIWARPDPDLAEIWIRSGPDLSKIWSTYRVPSVYRRRFANIPHILRHCLCVYRSEQHVRSVRRLQANISNRPAPLSVRSAAPPPPCL